MRNHPSWNPTRRELMRLSVAGVAGASVSGWFGLLADHAVRAAAAPARPKSCVLLWMAGGPAQSHTFDLKPGGEFKPIASAVPGVQISEHLPRVAAQMKDLALLRSMKTGDGDVIFGVLSFVGLMNCSGMESSR